MREKVNPEVARLSKRLDSLIRGRGIPIEAIASASKLSVGTIWNHLNGAIARPRAATIRRLERAIEIHEAQSQEEPTRQPQEPPPPQGAARPRTRTLRAWQEGILPDRESGEPYFSRPFALDEILAERLEERSQLTQWLASGEAKHVLLATGLGGCGKTTTIQLWLRIDLLNERIPGHAEGQESESQIPGGLRLDGEFVWNFGRDFPFRAFLDVALTYCRGGRTDLCSDLADVEKTEALLAILRKNRMLFVLDGFEHELGGRSESDSSVTEAEDLARLGANRTPCKNPLVAGFLRQLVARPLESRVIVVSRHSPRELDGLAGLERMRMDGLKARDAGAWLRQLGIEGSDEEVLTLVRSVGGHPGALRRLAGLILSDPAEPGRIGALSEYGPLEEFLSRFEGEFGLAFHALSELELDVLCWAAAFSSPPAFAEIAGAMSRDDLMGIKWVVRSLVNREYMEMNREDGFLRVHPIVGLCALANLSASDRNRRRRLCAELRKRNSTMRAPANPPTRTRAPIQVVPSSDLAQEDGA